MNLQNMTYLQIVAEYERIVSANEQAAQTIQRLAAELEAYREAYGLLLEEPPVFEDDFFAFDTAPMEVCDMEELSESEKNWYYYRESQIQDAYFHED
jgi:hypothetical protein